MNRNRLFAAIATAAVLGIGLIVLQRWVAETRFAAIALVGVWFALVGAAALTVVRSRPELKWPVLGTFAAVALVSGAVGYWTGFRDTEVDEDVVVATAQASPGERASGLAGSSTSDDADTTPSDEGQRKRKDVARDRGGRSPGQSEEPTLTPPTADPSPAGNPNDPKPQPETSEPVELATGEFTGEDGHDGSGVATVVREPSGDRTLTFTDFDVDPGSRVVVWLTQDETSFDDRVELGGLKGNVGDQEYAIPADADLRRYDTVVLYCTPFTVRIAVAPLS